MPLCVPDRVLILSWAQAPERTAAFEAAWTASNWSSVLGDAQMVNVASDGDETYRRWIAHVRALSMAVRDDVASVAVFEDVAVPARRSAGRLARLLRELPDATGGLWLDAADLGPRNRLLHGPPGARLVARPPVTTHAYLVTREWIDAVLPSVSTRPGPIGPQFANAEVMAPVFAAVPSLCPASALEPLAL